MVAKTVKEILKLPWRSIFTYLSRCLANLPVHTSAFIFLPLQFSFLPKLLQFWCDFKFTLAYHFTFRHDASRYDNSVLLDLSCYGRTDWLLQEKNPAATVWSCCAHYCWIHCRWNGELVSEKVTKSILSALLTDFSRANQLCGVLSLSMLLYMGYYYIRTFKFMHAGLVSLVSACVFYLNFKRAF